MIIDCHGHYTTVPHALTEFRKRQLAAGGRGEALLPDFVITDDEIRESLEPNQLRTQSERGVDVTLFSPTAGAMAHHEGDATASLNWSRACNDLVHRAVELYPDRLVGVCQLPESPGVGPKAWIRELERCVRELGFVGCNLNPDPTDGYWSDPPLTQRYWFPLFEKLVELDVPAMIHASCSCNPSFQYTGAHYINADTAVFMQLLMADVFQEFPTLRLVIPHGGGAVPYHWGRYRGLGLEIGRTTVEALMKNVFFDTCVYHQPGIELLLTVVPVDNILFASEIYGAVKGKDPLTGHNFDDTKRYIDGITWLDADSRSKILGENALRVYPGIARRLHLGAEA
jgi:4-oxalmesaconate hydratase